MTISSKSRFLSLAVIFGVLSNSLSASKNQESHKINRKLAKKNYWSTATTNIHQPVYTPGFGPYHAYSPMFLVPPPPQVAFSNLIAPTQVFNPTEKPIKRKVSVINYPQHLDNPTNFYSHPRSYNPFFGNQHPVNMNHPYNFLHGPAPFPSYGQPNYFPGFAGLAGVSGPGASQAAFPGQAINQAPQEAQANNQAPQGIAANQQMAMAGRVNVVNPMASPFGLTGFSNNQNDAFNPFMEAFNANGFRSVYNEPERQLGQSFLTPQPEFLDFDESLTARNTKRRRSPKLRRNLRHMI